MIGHTSPIQNIIIVRNEAKNPRRFILTTQRKLYDKCKIQPIRYLTTEFTF